MAVSVKRYARQMAIKLKDSGIENALLDAGGSTLLALEMALKEMVDLLAWVSRTRLQLIFKTIHLADQDSANAVVHH